MRQTQHRIFTTVVAAALSASACFSTANAFDLIGRFVNGTTGEPIVNTKIMLVNPGGGMMVEQETDTFDNDGRFRFTDLDEKAPIYLIRAPYKGVNYTEIVRFHEHDEVEIELIGYEPTTSWQEAHVVIPHMVVGRRGADSLRVDKYYQITNVTSPPRTITGEGARFTFFVPEDNLGIHELTTISLGVPLPRTPIPSEEPGVYAMEYPIKPGETRVSMAYSLPYTDGRYRYVGKFNYAIAEMMIYTEDPSLTIHSHYPGFARAEDIQGFAAYRVTNLQAGSELIIDFEGGSASAPAHASGTRVFVLPAASNNLSLLVLVAMFVLLAALLGYAISTQLQKDVEKRVLHARREELLNQLARLEDLRQAGAVSEQMFKLKRAELMSTLAQIYYRTKVSTKTVATGDSTPVTDAKGATSV